MNRPLSTGIHQPNEMSAGGHDEYGNVILAHESCSGPLCDTCPCGLCEVRREFEQLLPAWNRQLALTPIHLH